MDSLTIRAATEADSCQILEFIRALADFERLSHECEATESRIRATLFGANRCAEALIAELDGQPVGFGIFFQTYSTFLARPGLYLEDLFVQPAHRGKGIGKALLASVAQVAIERGCARLDWAVLDWNSPAWMFYEALGAEPKSDWTVHRMAGDSLAGLAVQGILPKSDQER